MQKAFELLVFDWDGTLMDSEGQIISCMQNALKDLELPAVPDENVSNVIGLGLSDIGAPRGGSLKA